MRFSPPPCRPTDTAQTARILDSPMPQRRIPLLLLILVTPLATAQDRGARVEREANNPLRMIIEASKIKPKAKPAEAVRPLDRSVPAAVPSAAVAASAPAELPRIAMPAGTVESTVATVEVGAEAERATVPSQPAPDPLSVPATGLAPLQLADMVEPVTPRMLLGKLRGEVQVVVSFTVRPDGSVVEPVVRSSSHPQMDDAVLEAVRQWRYQPIAAPRGHEVQLVLRQGG
ncbi:TonB family protein [Rhizobacter sp. AJA081-3]|uniref:energy transducer TonB n=1 Tax=Rhizobacter sp. AJA081-3 TaxID=2753607 RepID=UPI001AE0B420|nr:energy transducer TonB [Rhizobacter sp. AJA081-3]QTN25042.1 TonB family protein [Rhizobacter sp. AJA081-3]